MDAEKSGETSKTQNHPPLGTTILASASDAHLDGTIESLSQNSEEKCPNQKIASDTALKDQNDQKNYPKPKWADNSNRNRRNSAKNKMKEKESS